MVALTGSQGKTTVKEMLAAIFAARAPTLATEANLNNTIGVPLTLLRLEASHRYAVIEMGANQPGEIAFSVAATEPDLALITNASPTHTEGFGSLAGIVQAKGEIIDGVKTGGTVVLNADDPHCNEWQQRAARAALHTVTFSVEARPATKRTTAPQAQSATPASSANATSHQSATSASSANATSHQSATSASSANATSHQSVTLTSSVNTTSHQSATSASSTNALPIRPPIS